MIVKAAIAQWPAIIGPREFDNLVFRRAYLSHYIPADNPRMKPIPAPLAIPANKAFRAQGRSATCFALYYGAFRKEVLPFYDKIHTSIESCSKSPVVGGSLEGKFVS